MIACYQDRFSVTSELEGRSSRKGLTNYQGRGRGRRGPRKLLRNASSSVTVKLPSRPMICIRKTIRESQGWQARARQRSKQVPERPASSSHYPLLPLRVMAPHPNEGRPPSFKYGSIDEHEHPVSDTSLLPKASSYSSSILCRSHRQRDPPQHKKNLRRHEALSLIHI